MKKGLKIALISILGFFVVLILALQIVLNSSVVTRAVDKFATENLDGTLEYSDLKVSLFKRFPKIGVSVRGLSLTYPHDRFKRFDNPTVHSALLEEGRGAVSDTLLRLKSLDVAVNPWRMFTGRIRVSSIALDGLAAYAHQYDSTAANWQLFKSSSSPADTSSAKGSLPWISLGKLSIQSPRLVYTNSENATFAGLDMQNLSAGADVKIGDGLIKVYSARFRMDSLSVRGTSALDTLTLDLAYLCVDEPRVGSFKIGLDALAQLGTYSLGRLRIPISLNGRVNYDQNSERMRIGVRDMDVDIAFIPFHLNGDASFHPGRIDVKATANVEDCPVDSLLRNYADRFTDSAKKISTDARLSIDLEANGVYSEDRMPDLAVRVRVPESMTHYEPMDIDAELALDVSAELSEKMYLKVKARELIASIDGLDLNLHGSGDDILGEDPYYSLWLKTAMQLKPLIRFFPKSLGIKTASGDLDVDIEAGLPLSAIKSLKFHDASLNGTIRSNSLHLEMPSDSLEAKTFKTAIIASSSPAGLNIDADMDSVYFKMGSKMIARVREICNKGMLTKVDTPEGEKVPKLDVSTDSKMIFVQSGSSRFGVTGASAALSALKRSNISVTRRRLRRDSLSLSQMMDSLSHRTPWQGDIKFSLDSSVTKHIREWQPYGYIKVDNGFYASPAMPLRTRLHSFRARIDNDDIHLDSMFVQSGSSDLSTTIAVRDWRKALRKRSRYNARVTIDFGRLNINEIVAALKLGQKDTAIVAVNEETDESFVTDTLENAELQMKGLPLILMPGNVDAELYLNAGIVNYSVFEIGPASVDLKLKDKTLQMANTNVSTEMGKILLDAFYATRSREDLKAGVDLRLRDMSAYDIIHLVPTVDSMMPALKSFSGNLNCDISATAQIDTNMNVIIPSLDGLARINGDNLEVKDAGQLRRLTRLLFFKNKDIGRIDNLSVNAMVHDNKIEVFPFQLGVDRYKLALQGMQGFDKSMYYHVSILKSPFLVRFGINMFGYLDGWRFSLGRAKFSDGKLPAYTQQIDTVQVNIAKSIRNIFDSGVNEVIKYNDRTLSNLHEAGNLKSPDSVTSDPLSTEDYQMVDDVLLQQELMEQDEELMQEVEAVIADSYLDTAKLMKEYESKLYSKSILRKLERLKKQRKKEERPES